MGPRFARFPGPTPSHRGHAAVAELLVNTRTRRPLGLTIAPNGDILTVNGGNGNIVEVTPGGRQVAVKALDTTPTPPLEPGNGALFGLAVAPGGAGVYFVDDDTNTLNLPN